MKIDQVKDNVLQQYMEETQFGQEKNPMHIVVPFILTSEQ